MDRPDADGPGGDRQLTVVSAADLLGRCRFPPPGTAVGCAVSGGADSLALMVLAVEAGCRVTAIHVDHGIRPGSEREAEVVAEAARRVGASFRAERVTVPPGPNLEARAREARMAVLPPDALFGHTADDQAETVLINMLRGAGLPGLAGIRDHRRHPILGLRRAETRALCEQLGLEVVEDPSNLDPRHVRNRVRREVIPLLADVAQRDVVELLARQAALAAEAVGVLEGLAAEVDAGDVRALREVPEPVAAFALRRWVVDVTGSAHPPDAASLDRLFDVVRGRAVACELAGGWRVARSRGRLVASPPVGASVAAVGAPADTAPTRDAR